MVEPIKRLSRKDLSEMSTADYLRAARAPYRRLLSYLKPHKARFAMGVIFGILSGVFNFVLLFGFKFVFSVVLPGKPVEGETPFNEFEMPFTGRAVEIPVPEVGGEGEIWLVIGICAFIPLLILIRGLLGYFHQYCMIWVGNKVLYRLRDETFSGLLRQSQSFYNRAKIGELIQTVFNQTRMAQTAGTQLASDLIRHPVSILSILLFLIIQDPLYTVAAVVVFPLCILPVMQVSKKVRKAGGKEEEEAGLLMVTMQESFAGIRVVRAHAREEFERKKFNRASTRMLEFIMRWRKAMELVGPLVETVASMGMAAGLVYAWATEMPAQQFILLNMALMGMYPHVKALSRVQIQLQKCLMATSKVFSFMDSIPEVDDAKNAIELEALTGGIAFRDVSFSYVAGTPAVENIDLEFRPGKTYALVGRSGAGKSTLLSLLMRFYDPDGGSISVDGHDLREVTQRSLRDQVGFVSQETFLFHESIYRNILYGRLDATRAEVEEAARRAYAHEFILEQANGYDTVVGDKGCALSGGQQQRISIARAILRDPPILLLDEAYSALDSESEKKIHAALETLAKGKTVIAIAHRLSTILNADQIILMDGGRVEAIGTHAELLEKSGHYAHLYNLQFKVGEEVVEAK